jgi:GMP synthase (glutamine-hydrolysing)
MQHRHPFQPFLLLSIARGRAADDEYAAMMRFSGLDERSLPRIRMNREPLGSVDLDEWSGIILGGGPYNVSDSPAGQSSEQRRVESDLQALLDEVVARDFPFLGCCYGIGVLGMQIGATVDRTYTEPIGSVPVSLTAAGRADPLLGGLPEVFEAFVGHKEAARALPSDAVVLATPAVSGPSVPRRPARLCDAVPSRARRRRDPHPHRCLQGLRVLRTGNR